MTVKHKQNKTKQKEKKNIRVRLIVCCFLRYSELVKKEVEEEEGLSITSRFNVIETFIYPI